MKNIFPFLRLDKNQKVFYKLSSQAFMIRLLGMVLMYFYQICIARFLGTKGYGDYTVIFTWLNFFIVFSLMGFDTTVMRFFSSARDQGNFQQAKGFLLFSFRFVVILSALSSVLIFLWLTVSKSNSDEIFYDSIFIALFLIPVLVLINQCSAVLRSIGKVSLALIPLFILLPVLVIVSCFVYAGIATDELNTASVISIYLINAVVVCVFVLTMLRKNIRSEIYESSASYESKKWLQASFVLFAINIMNLLLRQVDIIFVSHYSGNAEAGIYAAASKMVIMLVPFGLSVVEFVYTPRIATLFETSNTERLQKMVKDASRLIMLITVPVCIGLVGLGKFLLALYGEDFMASYIPMIILIVGQLVNSLTGMVGMLLNMTGNHKILFASYFFTGIFLILLNFILVPAYGMTGAAVSTAFSMIVLNGINYFIVRKKLKINPGVL